MPNPSNNMREKCHCLKKDCPDHNLVPSALIKELATGLEQYMRGHAYSSESWHSSNCEFPHSDQAVCICKGPNSIRNEIRQTFVRNLMLAAREGYQRGAEDKTAPPTPPSTEKELECPNKKAYGVCRIVGCGYCHPLKFAPPSTPKDSQEIIQEGLERLYGAKPSTPFKSLEEAMKAFVKERTDAITEMFDNKYADGIYPTSKFFERLDKAVRQVWESGRVAEQERILGMIEGMMLMEVGLSPKSLMWKQRFNNSLTTLKDRINKK